MTSQIKIRHVVYLLVLSAALVVAAGFFSPLDCPEQGWAVSTEKRAFTRLKNRTRLPEVEDFDERVTLEALLKTGDDRERWTEGRAARIEGYVIAVTSGGIEAANCFSWRMRDTHIYVARSPHASTRERLVVEVTPRLREWASRRGYDWSEAALRSALVGRWCRIEGWMLFDREHAQESENVSPGRTRNWRATAWELHPMTGITVLK